jgi:hypothetical protein
MTFIAVHHRVTDRKEFWDALARIEANDGGAVRIKQVLRNEDGDRAVTLWEGETFEAIRARVDSELGAFSEHEYEAVKSARSWRMDSDE